MSDSPPQARAEASMEDGTLFIKLGGNWRITERRPRWPDAVRNHRPTRIILRAEGLGSWDSSLALYLQAARTWGDANQAAWVLEGFPEAVEKLTATLSRKPIQPAKPQGLPDLFTALGGTIFKFWAETKDLAQLVGDCVFSVGRFFRGHAQFRWRDCFYEMQQCGAMALPIVGLISFLVGVPLAYTGWIVVRQYGGDIWIADMVGLAVVREMGPMMAAIVLAGRTGAAYAATLGNMKANEEIDALETLGISPVQFLVLPRMFALTVMMPLLGLYANALGILGGMVVALGLMAIPPTAYWVEMQNIIDMSDIVVGVIKGGAFGFIVGLAGCLRGLQAEKSAAGVGRAATSAVVTALLLLIIADAIFAVLFNALGW